MAKFLPFARISDAHGKPVKVNSRLIVPMYHPAAALHQPSLKPTLEKDFLQLPELIRQGAVTREETRADEPEQNETHLSDNLPSESGAEQLSLF